MIKDGVKGSNEQFSYKRTKRHTTHLVALSSSGEGDDDVGVRGTRTQGSTIWRVLVVCVTWRLKSIFPLKFLQVLDHTELTAQVSVLEMQFVLVREKPRGFMWAPCGNESPEVRTEWV